MTITERPSHTAARLLNALRADRYIARNFADELFQLGSLIDAIARDAEMRPVVSAVTDKLLADMLEGGAIVRIDPSAMFKTDSESYRLAALAGAAPVGSTMATNFRGETFAESRQQLVNVLKTQKSWLTDYAETYVDEFAAMATPHAPAKAREDAIRALLLADDSDGPEWNAAIRAALATFAEGE